MNFQNVFNDTRRVTTPTLSDQSNDDDTSSSQASIEIGTRTTARPPKKDTQEVMKAFPPAEVTSETKKKTNWIYESNNGSKSSPGIHQVVRGKYDGCFKLLEGYHKGVDLMKLQKWHMVLRLSGSELFERALKCLQRDSKYLLKNHKWALVVRLKLKPNYKVKLQNGKYYDVNAEDCRMNFNPEGCFLITESDLEHYQENPAQLQGDRELAKFQEKNRSNKSKSYKECKNSVVRACQLVDKNLRNRFYETYMDILYEKAFTAKLKSCNNCKAAVEEKMGKKPSNWQSKRSTEPWNVKATQASNDASPSVPAEDLFRSYSPSVTSNPPVPYLPTICENTSMPLPMERTYVPAVVDKGEAQKMGHLPLSPPSGPFVALVPPNHHPSLPLPPPIRHHMPHPAYYHHMSYPPPYQHPTYFPAYYPPAQPAMYPHHLPAYPPAYPASPAYIHPHMPPVHYMPGQYPVVAQGRAAGM